MLQRICETSWKKLLASELNIKTDKIIPWEACTDADYKLTQTQKSSKRPCKNQNNINYCILN